LTERKAILTFRDGSYDDLALEYYDSERHPTAANFREASALVLERWLDLALGPGLVVEVGAGDSLVAELMHRRNLALSRLLITDASVAMVAHSEKWCSYGARVQVADATALPLNGESVGLLVSILGDPYNTTHIWREVTRVLHRGGSCIFTTPSHTWSETFRSDANEPPESAQFLVRGEKIRVQSFIRPVAEQREMITNVGLSVVKVEDVTITALSEHSLSEKLSKLRIKNDSVVTGYLIEKRT